MDLLKYLKPMKNIPERFSNLAFWRGVRKLRDKMVDTFEYVGEWGNGIEGEINSLKGDLAKVTKYPFTIDSRLYRSQYGTGQQIPKDSIIQLQLYCNSNTELFISEFYSTATSRRITITDKIAFACRASLPSTSKYEGKEYVNLKLMKNGAETDEVVGYALIDWTNVSSGGAGYVKGDANILESCIVRTKEIYDHTGIADALTSTLTSKVDKDGIDQIKSKNIDGGFDEFIENIIDGEFIGGFYRTGSGTIGRVGSGQTQVTKGNKINLNDYSGKLMIGFSNTEPMYGSNIFFLGDGVNTGCTCIEFYSKNKILSNLYNLFDLSLLEENKVIIDLDGIKAKYPNAVGMFICEPSTVWYLASLEHNEKKELKWLKVGGYIPSIVVAKDGSGDYTSIQDAINNADNDTTIYIKDGEYKETVIVNKYVHLVGQSKHGTILYQNIGDYNNAPLRITQGSVCNMTIKSARPADVSGLTDYAYAIHLDKSFANESKYRKCEIYNCDIISEVNDAIGAGTNYDEVFDVHDCFIYVVSNPVKTGACGFKCHVGASQTGGKITLKNNTIIAENSNGTSFYDVLLHDGGLTASIKIPVELIGNVCKTFRNVSTVYELNQYCYGNSVPTMNTLN